MKSSNLKLALASLVLVLLFSGCWSNNTGGCGKSRLSQKEADHLLLNLLAEDYNKKQTNWTILVVPRTSNNATQAWGWTANETNQPSQ